MADYHGRDCFLLYFLLYYMYIFLIFLSSAVLTNTEPSEERRYSRVDCVGRSQLW